MPLSGALDVPDCTRREPLIGPSASTQPRVSVNWWKRTARPSRKRQTWAKGMSSGSPVFFPTAV